MYLHLFVLEIHLSVYLTFIVQEIHNKYCRVTPVADLRGGARDACPPPPGGQILSISCSFWEILAKSYVGAPPPEELAPPPRGNPGPATAPYPKTSSKLLDSKFTQVIALVRK